MTELVIALDEEQERRLRDLADSEQRSPEDLGREALARFLNDRTGASPAPLARENRHSALKAMIGLAKGGTPDSSVRHDWRPEDEVR